MPYAALMLSPMMRIVGGDAPADAPKRNKARENKNYELADKIRKELLDKGVSIEDKNGKTFWKYK